MKNWKRIVPILLVLALLAGCGQTAQVPATPDVTPPATGAPSSANLPAVQSPAASSSTVETPPAAEPPVTEPPASEPPAVEPPVSEPPVVEPSVSEPPASEPPAVEPPVSQPPVSQPPASQPPVSQPPVSQPPVSQPPASQPSVSQPPASQPPVSQPPVSQPPVSQPPVSQPPASQPPVSAPPAADPVESIYIDPVYMSEEDLPLANEMVALAASPAAIPDLLLPEASGMLVKDTTEAVLDYSNTGDGYVMVRYKNPTDKKLQARVTAPNNENTFIYLLTPEEWTVLPLSDGNGDYTIKVYRQNTTKYATLISLTITVELKDEFAPFLRPNQYVDYAVAENTLAEAAKLMGNESEPLEKVQVAYEFVVKNLTYDTEKANTVQSGYLPVLDDVLAAKKGICFDYAALMTGMLRSQGVPCKLVVGYAGTEYHAWISVWTEEHGWIDSAVYFDGQAWHRMDPTYASSASRSSAAKAAETMEFIKNDAKYKVKFLY